MNAATPSVRRLVGAYLALLALLALTASGTLLPPGPWSTPLSLGIATAKAALIFVCFMRLRDQPGLVRVFALAGIFWLAILLGLTFVDFATRRWPV